MEAYSSKLEQQLRDLAREEGVQKLVVGGVVLSPDRSSILLLRRHPSDFMPLLIELPSGGVIEGETFVEALVRLVKEETGLIVDEIKLYLSTFDYTSQSKRRTRQFNFEVSTVAYRPIVLIPNEHVSYFWRPLRQTEHLTPQMQEIFEIYSEECVKSKGETSTFQELVFP